MFIYHRYLGLYRTICYVVNWRFTSLPVQSQLCVELVDNFGDQAHQAGYDPRESVNFRGRVDTVQELSKSYKTALVASDVEISSMSTIW